MAMEETGHEGKLTAEQKSELLDTLFEHTQRDPGKDHALFPLAMYFVASGISSLENGGNKISADISALAKDLGAISSRLDEISSESNSQYASVMEVATDIVSKQKQTQEKLLKAEQIGLIRQRQLCVMLLLLGVLGIISLSAILWMLLT